MKKDKKRLNILGASGYGKVVADIARLNGYAEIYFYDDDESIKSCAGYPVIGSAEDLNTAVGHIFIAIGNGTTRKRLMEKYGNRNFPVLVHPNATIAEDVKIDDGTVIIAGAVINPGVVIGRGCIVNTSSSIDHDCKIGDYVHVSVGSHLSGTVNVGELTWIGAGTTVKNNVIICSNTVIGAGAVVIKNIEESGTYIGVPAKKMIKDQIV